MLIYDPQKIVSLRKGKGWTQAEFARCSGLSQPSVWALEHGETKMPKYETLEKIAGALGVPVRAILAAKATTQELHDAQDDMLTMFERLSAQNKIAILAATRAVLETQK